MFTVGTVDYLIVETTFGPGVALECAETDRR